jgi:hypothetical protein
MARAIMLVLPNTKFGAPPSSKVYPVSQRNRESQIREDGNWRPPGILQKPRNLRGFTPISGGSVSFFRK